MKRFMSDTKNACCCDLNHGHLGLTSTAQLVPTFLPASPSGYSFSAPFFCMFMAISGASACFWGVSFLESLYYTM